VKDLGQIYGLSTYLDRS